METSKTEPTIKRIGGYLNRVVPITDSAGKIVNYALKPLMVEFRLRDLMQVIVGASILSLPFGAFVISEAGRFGHIGA